MIYKKSFENINLKDKQGCIDTLLNSGLRVLDKDTIMFSEGFNFSTDTGGNNRKLFLPRLTGKLVIDKIGKKLSWEINVNRSLIIWVITTSILVFIYSLREENDLTTLIFSGIFYSAFFILISLMTLKTRINKLTEKLKI